jgi:hypothetical protein
LLLIFQHVNGQEYIGHTKNPSVSLSSGSSFNESVSNKPKFKQQSDSLEKQDYYLETSAPSPEIFNLPIIGYSPETGLRGGLGLRMVFYPKEQKIQKLPARPSVITPAITYGFKNKQVITALEADIYAIKGWQLHSHFRYSIHETNYYFGTGGHSGRVNKQAYMSNSLRLNGSMLKMFRSGISAGVGFSAQHDTPLEFEKEATPNPDGINGGWIIGTGPALQIDHTNNYLFPTRGSFLDAAFFRYGLGQIGNYQYNEVKLDYRKYIPSNLLVNGSVFAFQALFHGTWGGTVPFYKLPYITNDRALRGMWRNLYIDRQIISIQGEFRSFFSPNNSRYGYALFAGAADGASNFSKSYSPDIKIAYGAGLRMQLLDKQRLVLRVDGAFSNKGDMGIYSGIGVAF